VRAIRRALVIVVVFFLVTWGSHRLWTFIEAAVINSPSQEVVIHDPADIVVALLHLVLIVIATIIGIVAGVVGLPYAVIEGHFTDVPPSESYIGPVSFIAVCALLFLLSVLVERAGGWIRRLREGAQQTRFETAKAERIKQETVRWQREQQERNEIDGLVRETLRAIQEASEEADEGTLQALALLNSEVSNLANDFSQGNLPYDEAKSRITQVLADARTLSQTRRKPRPVRADAGDYYAILGVDVHATTDEIRRAWRQKVLQFHPDRTYEAWKAKGVEIPNWVRAEADRMTKKLNEIKDTLTDPTKRKEYDRKAGIR